MGNPIAIIALAAAVAVLVLVAWRVLGRIVRGVVVREYEAAPRPGGLLRSRPVTLNAGPSSRELEHEVAREALPVPRRKWPL